MIRAALLAALFVLGEALPAQAQPGWSSSRPDGHAPIGVMGDHTHVAGEFMFSYRYRHMQMEDLRVGIETVPADEVLDPDLHDFRAAPLQMTTQMHLLGGMYAPTDRLTLMAMADFHSRKTDHRTRGDEAFTTRSSGLGDVKLSALVDLHRFRRQALHLNAGVSLPTGNITQRDVTPMSAPDEALLPYPMQIGSGTFDLMPGLTYLGQIDNWSWGAQVMGRVRLGENERGYRLGNHLKGTLWGAMRLSHAVSLSIRLEGTTWGNISGADPALEQAAAERQTPTVMTNLRAGQRLDAGLGVNYYLHTGPLAGLRLAAEVLAPPYQRLEGPQLETNWQVIIGVQYAFLGAR